MLTALLDLNWELTLLPGEGYNLLVSTSVHWLHFSDNYVVRSWACRSPCAWSIVQCQMIMWVCKSVWGTVLALRAAFCLLCSHGYYRHSMYVLHCRPKGGLGIVVHFVGCVGTGGWQHACLSNWGSNASRWCQHLQHVALLQCKTSRSRHCHVHMTWSGFWDFPSRAMLWRICFIR